MHFRHIILLALLLQAGSVSAKEVRDTLKTRAGDRIIVPYEYSVTDGQMTVHFRPALKRLSEETSRRYRKQEELTVVIFDRNGSYVDAAFSGDPIPEAFMVPAELSYTVSREGYYLLHESPTLSFALRGDARDVEISIPAYLAQHVKKGRYKLISRCGSIQIKVARPAAMKSASAGGAPVMETVTSTVEIEADNGDMTRVLDCIANINSRLPYEDRLPMSESLEGDVRLLREWKYSVSDRNLKDRVAQTLDAYEQKKRQLEDAAAAQQRAEQRKIEEDQRRAEEEMKAQAEAEEAKRQEETEKNRKKNIWMVIGGIIAAAGAFVGNQLLQSSRTRKSQKDMMEMQQSLAKKAEDEALRRAGNIARSEVNRSVDQVRRKAENTVRQGVRKAEETVRQGVRQGVRKAEDTVRQGVHQGVGKVVGKNKNKKNFTI